MQNRDIKQRVLYILENELRHGELKNKEGLNLYPPDFWNALKRKDKDVRVNEEHLHGISIAFPEYRVWITTGLVFPEKGHISPEIRKEQEKQKLMKRAGQ